MLRRRSTLALLAVAAAALAPGDAGASVSIVMTFDKLVGDSTAAAVITPITQMSLWEDGRIVTYTDAHVDTAVAGTLADEVWLRNLGGSVGHIGQSVEGEAEMTVGHPCLVFVHPAMALRSSASIPPAPMPGVFSVTGRAQGEFPVVRGDDGELRVVKSSGIGATMAPKGVAMPTLAVDALHGLKVSDATDTVAEAWSRLHGP